MSGTEIIYWNTSFILDLGQEVSSYDFVYLAYFPKITPG